MLSDFLKQAPYICNTFCVWNLPSQHDNVANFANILFGSSLVEWIAKTDTTHNWRREKRELICEEVEIGVQRGPGTVENLGRNF